MAAASFGLVLALTQHEVAALDGRVRSAFTMLLVGLLALAGALLWPVVQGGDFGSLQWPQGDDAATGWWGLLFLALFYGSAFTILFTVLPRWGAVGNSPIMNIEPVMALFMAWLVLGQAVAHATRRGALGGRVCDGAGVEAGLGISHDTTERGLPGCGGISPFQVFLR